MRQKKSFLLCIAGILSLMLAASAHARVEIDRIDSEGGEVTYSSQGSGPEAATKLFDGHSDTKWLAGEPTPWVQLDFLGEEKNT